MDPEKEEFLEFLKKQTNNQMGLGKIKYKIKLMKIPNSEVNGMRELLIREAKPIFANFYLGRKNTDFTNELCVKCFDKRIMSLPKEIIVGLYSAWQSFNNAKSKESKELFFNFFITELELSYSLNRWFRKKIVQYMTTGQI